LRAASTPSSIGAAVALDKFLKGASRRPGEHVRGVFLDLPELYGRRLELHREAIAGLTRVAALRGPSVLNGVLTALAGPLA
jgi:hypothetical protein